MGKWGVSGYVGFRALGFYGWSARSDGIDPYMGGFPV